ncbi:23S ribosomal RNA methyltransferase Erm [Paenibacillus sp.]|jgi:23S rRNA (adenine-N6)-dimethyltransferase|uniref:23S ribosomal RNA methyltransferase Erm n=1 Tax=Paenibacillus sp. TaxID=58172 RepID=UPI00281AD1B2|nr:23S ribosomal RNA methyltransferase Erm [Paenibacillus sp.]MDR0268110.1 23S ribosomal RNA methyltransferase Erm [Paenibacillus sp.]
MYKHNRGLSGTPKREGKPDLRAQHLLHNKQVIQEMVDYAGLTSIDTVLDLGAGKGAITFHLAETAGKVVAIEKDAAFAEALRRKAEEYANVAIVERDIQHSYLPKKPFHVVANIPFFITTPILEKLLNPPVSSFQGAVLIVQHGAAKGFTNRFIRSPRLLKWRMWFDIDLVKMVPRRHFSPPPRVDAAVLRIRRKKTAEIDLRHHHTFEGLAEYALKHPELPVSGALQGIFTPPQMKQLMISLKIDRHAPICSLNELQWGIVFHTMLERVPSFRWPKRKKKSHNGVRSSGM